MEKILDKESFGSFLANKRKGKQISLRALAAKLGVSAPYLYEVEKGRKAPLNLERILLVSRILLMKKEEEVHFLDLAGEYRESTVPPDLPEYINAHAFVRDALRAARDLGAEKSDWQGFTDRLSHADMCVKKSL